MHMICLLVCTESLPYDANAIVAAHRQTSRATRKANQFKIVMLGVENAGKTSTVDSLLGNPFKDRSSTVGADTHLVVSKNELTLNRVYALEWDEKDIDQQLADLSVHHHSERKETMTEFLQQETLDNKIEKNISQKEIKESQSAIYYDKTPDGRIAIFDLGGQEVYYELHFLFLASQDVVFLTFNASVDLDEKVIRRCRPSSGYSEYQTTRNLSNLDAIELTLQMIHSHCGEKTGDTLYSKYSPKYKPIVVMLGTHAHNIPAKEKRRIKNKIFQHFDKSVLLEHFLSIDDGIFFIDNKHRDKETFLLVKKLAVNVAYHSINEDRLISYLYFEEAILKKSKFVAKISKQEAIKIAGEAGLEKNEQTIQELLEFYTSRGILLYYPEVEVLQDTVFTSPQEVSDLISTVLCTHQYSILASDFRRKCRRFEEYGLLEESLLDDMVKLKKYPDWKHTKKLILALLDTFHLAVQIDTKTKFECEDDTYKLPESGNVYFVPSMLIYDKETEKYKNQNGHICNLFVFYFPDQFLCDNIFNHVLLSVIAWCNSKNHNIRR